jgi:hypothetical protein
MKNIKIARMTRGKNWADATEREMSILSDSLILSQGDAGRV